MRHVALAMIVVAGILSANVASATTYYWSSGSTGNTGIWDSTSTFWGTASGAWNTTAWTDASPGNAAYFQGTAGTVTIPTGETRTISGLSYSTAAYYITGGSLNLDNGGSAVVFAPQNVAGTIASPITGSAGLNLVASTNYPSFLYLFGNNTYTGPTTVTMGILVAGNSNALGTNPSVTFGAAGSSRLDMESTTSNGSTLVLNKNFFLTGGQINGGGQIYASYILPTNDNMYEVSGSVTCATAVNSRVSGHFNTSLNVSGPIILSSTAGINLEVGTRSFSLDAVGNILNKTGTITLSGNISGAGGLITENGDPQAYSPTAYYGLGNYVISGNNSYSGTTTVGYSATYFGTWTIKSGNALGATSTGTYVYNNSALQLDGSGGALSVPEPLTINGTGTAYISGNSVTYTYTAGTTGVLRNLAGNNTLSGAITLASASRINSDTDTLNIAGNITNGTYLLTVGGAGNTTISGMISPSQTAGGLTKDGSGTLTLSNGNYFTGATTLSAGTLVLANQNALYGSTLAASAGSLIFDSSAGGAFTFGGLSGSINVALQDNAIPTPNAVALSVGNNNANTAYSGALSGPGSLTKIGTGILTLSGANTYAGPTTISTGTLQFANTGAMAGFGSSAANVIVAAGATLGVNAGGPGEFTDANINSIIASTCGTVSFGSNCTLGIDTTNAAGGRFTYGYAIGGSLGLTKLGANSLVLSAANTYTGPTNINAGAVVFANTGAMPAFTNFSDMVNVASGATLGVNAGGPGEWAGSDISTLLGLYNVVFSSGSMLGIDTTNAPGPVTLTTAISGNNGLNKLGTGTLILSTGNTYAGPTAVTAGTLAYAAGTSLLNSSGVTVSGGMLDMAGYTDTVKGVTVAGGLIANGTLSSTTAFAMQAGTVSAMLSGTVGLAKTTTGAVYLNAANTYTGTTTVTAGTLFYGINNALPSTAVTVNGGTLNMGVYSGSVTSLALSSGLVTNGTLSTSGAITVSGGTLSLAGGSAASVTLTGGAIGATGTLTSNANFAVSAGTISGGLGGSVGLTKTGTGSVILSGANTYSGLTAVSAGYLVVTNSQALGNSSGGSATGTGSLILSGNGIVVAQPMTVSGFGINGETYYSPSQSIIGAIGNDGGSNTVSGVVTASASWRSYPRSGSTLTFSNSVINSGASYFGGNGDLVFAGPISGSGAMNLQGDNGRVATLPLGTMYLTGNNSAYTGTFGFYTGTPVSVMRFNLQNADAVGSGGILENSTGQQTIQLQSVGGIAFTARPMTLFGVGGTVSLNGSPTINGALENVAGNNAWPGAITLGTLTTTGASVVRINSDANTLTVNNIGGGTVTSGSSLTTSYSLTVGGAGNTTVNGVIANGLNIATVSALSLTKDGLGTLTLTGANLYTGATTVSAGTLQLGDGTTNGTIPGNITDNAALAFNYGVSTSPTYTGVISGTGTLTKSGAGTVTLTGANTYSGLTTVNAGELALTGLDAVASPGAWNPVLYLGGADIMGGQLVFSYAGGADPVSTITGLLNNKIYTTATGEKLTLTDDTVNDNVILALVAALFPGDANGDGTVNGADLNIVLSNYNQTVPGGLTGWKMGDFNGDDTVNGADLNIVLSNYNQSVSATAAVPEPSTLLLAAAGLAALLAYAWRKGK